MFPSFVKKRLDAVRAAVREDDCRLLVLTGGPRKGKSTLGLRFARYIDPAFTLERITFRGRQFKQACVASPRGSAVGLDEAIRGGNARRAMSHENVEMMDWLTIWGHRNLYGWICYPSWRRLDGAIKDFVFARVHLVKKGVAVWFDVYHPEHADKPVLIRRVKFRFDPIPDGPFRAAYEARKTEFTKGEAKQRGGSKIGVKELERIVGMARRGVSQGDIANTVGISQARVSQLLSINKRLNGS